MARTDYVDAPDAPRPTSIVIAASALVLDATGRLVLIRRTDSGLHAQPGGRHELGETISETAVRETLGGRVRIAVTKLVGIYSDPSHVVEFSDGEVRQEFSICFRGEPVTGEPRGSDESTEVHWVERDELASLDIHPSIRLRIDHGFAVRPEPYYT